MRLNRVLEHFLQHKILIGVTEFMPESMELLRFALDADDEVERVFRYYSSPQKKKLGKERRMNKSQISTSQVLEAIKLDKEIWDVFTRHVKHEMEMYRVAVEIHKMQHQWIKLQMKP